MSKLRALNPLHWVTGSARLIGAAWRNRPQMTRKRLLVSTTAAALLGTGGAGGYYGWQKWQAPRNVAAVSAPSGDENGAGPNGADGGDSLAPIPDTSTEPASLGPPSSSFVSDNDGFRARALDRSPPPGAPPAEQGAGADPAYAPPPNGYAAPDPGGYGAGPPPSNDAPIADAPGVEPQQGGAEQPGVDSQSGDPGAAAGGDPSAQPIADPTQSGLPNGMEGGLGGAPAAAPEAPVGIPPETEPAAPGQGNQGGQGNQYSPGNPGGQGASEDLVPVPSSASVRRPPEPSPPEEHVAVPSDAGTDLSPNGFAPQPPAPAPPNGFAPSNGFAQPNGFGAQPNSPPDVPRTTAPDDQLSSPPPSRESFAPAATSPSRFSADPSSADAAPAQPLADTSAVTVAPSPGATHLEGPQAPSLTIEKRAPEEVQVGRAAVFEILVRNVGRTAAQRVAIVDQVPRGTRLLETDPPCQRGGDGMLTWQLGTLDAGQEARLTMRLLPEQEGEIGSVAQAVFHSQASVRTVCTRPQIAIQHRAPSQVLIGDQATLEITLTNNGSGAATDLVIDETVPEGMTHPAGAELEYPVGTLRPGETKRIELKLKAVRPGTAQNLLIARSGEQTLAEDRIPLEIVAPKLQVAVTGPKVRYLDRQATYSVSVVNPGTAPATNLELVAQLPRGLKFVSADNQGQYDAQRHAVFWGLAELPAGVTGASQLVVVPIEPGEQRLRVEGRADLELSHAFEQAVVVETLSELQFTVSDRADPIEEGSETAYEIRLVNRGSRAASNVRIAAELPAELSALSGEGPSRVTVRNGQVVIEPLARLAPDSEAVYLIRARGVRRGDPRVRVQVASDEAPNPVTKEESTRVYADQ